MGELRFADVTAGVSDVLAAYAHALDDGRADDVVATFTPDGVIDLPGMGTHSGADELLAAFTGWAPRRPQRHLVLNTHVHEWSDNEAMATSDVVLLLLTKEGWSTQLVGRYHDTLVLSDDGQWRFKRRRAEFVTAD